MKKYSSRAQRLVELLSEDEIQRIQKDYPFRVERNNKLRELYGRGVTQIVLAEVSGLSGAYIWKICGKRQPVRRFSRAGEV